MLPRLKEALGHPGNWVSHLPDGQRPMVTLRPRPEAANEVALHPLGTLTVKQNVVPLNLEITQVRPDDACRRAPLHDQQRQPGGDQTTHRQGFLCPGAVLRAERRREALQALV